MKLKNSILSILSLLVSIAIILVYILSTVLGFEFEFWRKITVLGDEVFYVGILPIIYHGVSRSLGIELIVLITSSIWVGNTLKNTLKIPRPPESLWLVRAEGYSFPSGHALGSTIVWGFFSIHYRKLIPTALVIVTFVSLSRIFLRVHYVIDIIGGISIGLLILLTYLVVGNTFMKASTTFKLTTLLLAACAFLAISATLSTLTYVEYSSIGVMTGSALGHLLLSRSSRNLPKPNPIERAMGSILGLLVSFIGYKLSKNIVYEPLLLIHYIVVAFTMTYVVGLIIDFIRKRRASK